MSESGRQFIQVYLDFVDSKAFDNLSGNALKLYLRMRRYVCRARSGHSLSDFYIKGLLAMSGYLNQYAKAFGVSKSSVCRWLKELEDAKFIASYYKAQKGANQPNIWILGRVLHVEGSKHGVEFFFADHDAMAQEPDEKVAGIFDQSKGDVVIAKMTDSEQLYNKAYTVAPMQQCVAPVEHPVAPVQRSNREELIDKTNIPPPEKTEAGQPPTPKANIHRLLQATKTQGEDETPKSALAEYIGQKINPVPSGQRNDLARPYTEHLPGGEKRKHPSPDELWVSHPRFPDWVEERIKWAVDKGGSAAAQRKRAVNAVCKYKGNEWAWLDWLASQVEANPLHRFKPVDDGPSQEDIDWWEREHGGGE